jgi:hypothetical protein
MELPTKGSLSEVSLIEILKDASTSGLTGMLRLETGSVIKVVYLQNGTIAFASSNEKSDRLTEVLKRAGKLTPEQIEHAQARIKPNVSLGKTLVELGYISPKDLLWGARMQVEGILYQLLFWERGSYQVLEGPLPKEIVSLGLTIPQIIYAGILQTKDRDWILKHIGSPEAVYVFTDPTEQKLDQYKLPVNEVISKMNGTRTLEEIAQASGVDTFEVCKTVAALQILDLAQPQQNKPVQMPLMEPKSNEMEMVPVLDETNGQDRDISLGEVMQIPTVDELQQQAAVESNPQPVQFGDDTREYSHSESSAPIEEYSQQPVFTNQEEPAPFIQQPYDDEETDEEQSGGWMKIILIIALLSLVAAATAFYFYQKSNSNKPGVGANLPVSKEQPEPVQPQQTPEQPPVEPAVSKTDEVQAPNETDEPSTTPVGEVVKSSALQLAAAGNLPEAAKVWKRDLNKERKSLTIQVEIACQAKTVMEALSLFGASSPVYVVPLNFKGQSCYRVLYGTYKSQAQAENDRASLPQEFLQQPSPPKVIPVWKALQ